MYRLRLFLALLVFLTVSFLFAQPDSLKQSLDAILSGPHDREQLSNVSLALVKMINSGEVVSDTLFEQAIAMAEELEAMDVMSKMYLNRSIYDMNAADLTKGILHVDKAIDIAEVIGNESIEADAYNVKIRMMAMGGEMKEAANIAAGMVSKYHERGDIVNEALTYILLSRLSASLEDYSTTLRYDSIGIDLARQAGDERVLIRALYEAAEHFVFLDYPTEGLALATEAMELAQEHDQRAGVIGNIVNTLMGANVTLGNYDAALENLAIMKEVEGEQKYPWWMVTKGRLLQRIGRKKEARDLLLEAVEMVKATSNSPVLFKRAYRSLQTVDLNQGEYDTVLHYEQLIKEQQDSLQVAKNIRHLQELEEKYRAGEKDAEIRLQKEKLATQQTMLYSSVVGLLFALFALLGLILLSQRLKKRNIEKEALIGEIHHRVKNNLQVVSSLLQIQRRGLDADDEKGREALQESQNRVSAMGLIHNKLYQGKEVTSVHMPDYLEDLGNTLLDAYRLEEQVSISYDIEDIFLDVDRAIPLGLIINELIANCLKYAFPKGREGTIEISLLREEEGLKLKVSDDGVGVAAAEKRTDSTSFGKNLTGLLTKKLKGELKITEGKGYCVEILFGERR